jgi:hypothetical protein
MILQFNMEVDNGPKKTFFNQRKSAKIIIKNIGGLFKKSLLFKDSKEPKIFKTSSTSDNTKFEILSNPNE